ncbi:nocobactin polyketide synthase NbtC [Nocardia brasiliensis]|uniref:nocobactin polyketide synthase NbtC n=1 Tax=Nocardia brasiliensis TaxID=37326 RepID=UPI00189520E3|nr:nocobactin polyketide synthase NbtC [Nocardia brasiliensis]MBF6125127.1 nocobactin polyketide synthase NbtC [Nocardia brasiliensis]
MSDYCLPNGSIPVLLSSDADDSLRREAGAILSYLEDHPAVGADQVSDMLLRTRKARRHRALALVTGRTELATALGAIAAGEPHPSVIATGTAALTRKIGYVFPGQGSQHPGMGRPYYQHSPVFRAAVDECEAVFQELFDISPLSYLLAESDPGGFELLRIVQSALFMQMIGLAAMWRAVGVEPVATIGHSQGEIAAGVVSGVMTLADGVRVVTLRGGLVDTIGRTEGMENKYSMAVLGIDRDECEAVLARESGFVELSVINSAHVLAIGGDQRTVADIVRRLNEQGKFAKEIRVSYPAHTSLVSEFRANFLDPAMVAGLDRDTFAATGIDCIGATLGAPLTPDLPVGDYWYWNLRNRVRFDLAITHAAERGVDVYLEIADHPTLFLATQENLSAVNAPHDFQTIGTSRRSATDLGEFSRNVGLVAVQDLGFRWEALRHNKHGGAPALPLLDFPNTQMNERKLWAPYTRTAESTPAAGNTATPVQADRLVEQWVRSDRRKMRPPRAIALLDPTGRCTDLVAAVAAAGLKQGASVVDSDGKPDTIVVLLPESTDDSVGTAVSELAEFLGEHTWFPDLTGVGDLWLVTVGGEQVRAAEVPDLFHAAAQAGFRSFAPEHVGVGFRHLDLARGEEVSAAAKTIVAAVHSAGEPELASRDGGLYRKRLVADDISVGTPLRAADLRETIIIGGTGKLGLEFCAHFARHGAGRITLLSRSGGSPETAEKIRRIADSSSTEIVVRSCDVRDEAAVRALAEEYAATPATLIVHAAVDYAAAATLSSAAVRAAAEAKVFGLEHIVRHLPRAADGRVVLCSSFAATVGGRGNVVYALVNRMLDVAARSMREQGIDCTSVQWGLWPEVGAGREEALARTDGTGVYPLEPAAAIDLGLTTHATNHIVAAGDWKTVRVLSEMIGLAPLFAELGTAEEPEPQAQPKLEADKAVPVAEPAVADSAETADRVRYALRAVMGLDMTEAIDGSTPLVALGLDSLQALDLRKRIETELKRQLPVTAILGGASLDEVVTLLGR